MGGRSGKWRTAVMLLPALTALTAPHTVAAQDTPTTGFSLPPGAPPPQFPPSNVQGPVDSESTPPRRADQPTEQQAEPPVKTIAPVPVPQNRRPAAQQTTPRQRTPAPQATERTAPPAPSARDPRPQAALAPAAEEPVATAPDDSVSNAPDASSIAPDIQDQPPAPPPGLPGSPAQDMPEAAQPGTGDGRSIWLWLAAGIVALISLVFMAMRQRSAARKTQLEPEAPFTPQTSVPTPPLRTPPAPRPIPVPTPAPPPASPVPAPPLASTPFGTMLANAGNITPAPAAALHVAPAPAATPTISPTRAPASAPADAAPAPRMLLDFSTLGVDVTLVNAVARFHLAVTNMADITVSDIAMHGAMVQARRGMPPTIDPLLGDQLLPAVQKLADIAPGGTQRCEGQMRLALNQIEPIEMQGRLLFVPLVHIWIGYSGPDGTRYAVTQSFVLGEESTPPGQRVGPLRLDLGPRRFSGIGQRPLQPA